MKDNERRVLAASADTLRNSPAFVAAIEQIQTELLSEERRLIENYENDSVLCGKLRNIAFQRKVLTDLEQRLQAFVNSFRPNN